MLGFGRGLGQRLAWHLRMHASDRRRVLLGMSTTAATSIGEAVAAEPARPATYDEAARRVWRPLDSAGGPHELVRAATLAANSHNTQPWRFTVSEDKITIAPDLSRRCPAVDPDDHHLFASLGCAAENVMQAAPILGFKAEVRLDPSHRDRLIVALECIPPSRNALALAIDRRQCTRGVYDGRAASAEDLRSLQSVGMLDGVVCMIVTERPRMEAILDYVVQGNTAQVRDPAFMAELISWIRFNDTMALEHLDGLSARCTGNPSLPTWLARRLLPFVLTEKGENDKYAKHIRSSAGLAVFAAATNDKAGWVAAGRAYQRFALQATVLGIRQAFVNQPVEVAALRPQLATYLGLGDRRPDLVVRFGRGPALPASLRRPTAAVIDPS
jgi:hypothetical protein